MQLDACQRVTRIVDPTENVNAARRGELDMLDTKSRYMHWLRDLVRIHHEDNSVPYHVGRRSGWPAFCPAKSVIMVPAGVERTAHHGHPHIWVQAKIETLVELLGRADGSRRFFGLRARNGSRRHQDWRRSPGGGADLG